MVSSWLFILTPRHMLDKLTWNRRSLLLLDIRSDVPVHWFKYLDVMHPHPGNSALNPGEGTDSSPALVFCWRSVAPPTPNCDGLLAVHSFMQWERFSQKCSRKPLESESPLLSLFYTTESGCLLFNLPFCLSPHLITFPLLKKKKPQCFRTNNYFLWPCWVCTQKVWMY